MAKATPTGTVEPIGGTETGRTDSTTTNDAASPGTDSNATVTMVSDAPRDGTDAYPNLVSVTPKTTENNAVLQMSVGQYLEKVRIAVLHFGDEVKHEIVNIGGRIFGVLQHPDGDHTIELPEHPAAGTIAPDLSAEAVAPLQE